MTKPALPRDKGGVSRPAPDQAARDRIDREFSKNLLVEAGAGSGKTHSLARRMAAGIAAGEYQVEHMAAVTFTRKAAAELRGRFQLALEERLAEVRADLETGLEEAKRLEHALGNLERFYAGTIHAFCAHLLRERPVESGIAPGFGELDEIEDARRREDAWRDYIVRAKAAGKPELEKLFKAGLRARDLDSAFRVVSLYEEVTFPPGAGAVPDCEAANAAIDRFWKKTSVLLPDPLPPDSTCPVQAKLDEMRRLFGILDRSKPVSVAKLMELWRGRTLKATQKCWRSTSEGKQVTEILKAFQADAVFPFLDAWQQYLYRLSVTLLIEARDYAAAQRRRYNTLNYSDLLQAAARVLREKPHVRRALQQKYRWLFVDEFQDTDPVQAEIIVLLAADENRSDVGRTFRSADEDRSAALDWTTATLRPGALFVVGDPKQSIYRFRRADIDIYTRVKRQIEDSGGTVVPLTANFRSLLSVCEWVNEVFVTKFPGAATQHAPAFERLDAFRAAEKVAGHVDSGIRVLDIAAAVEERKVRDEEADAIARYIRQEVEEKRRSFGDFLILTRKKKPLAAYSRALEKYNIPLEVTGAGAFGSCDEVKALAALLRALGDPQDAVSLVGVLRGPLFGISDPELFEFVQGGHRLWLFEEVTEGSGSAASAKRVADAIDSLQQLYRLTRMLPAAAAVDRILELTGYLALAATTPAAAGAGDLLHAIDRIRQVSEDGGTLMHAVAALEDDEEEASNEIDSLPLEPGRSDVVRLMNLHKAKGLEARVVFLADPCGGYKSTPDVRIIRNGGAAEGYFQIKQKFKNGGDRIIAAPGGWDQHAAEEQRYLDAEGDRLLYVAATRARDLLVIGRWLGTGGRGVRAWAAYDSWLTKAAPLRVPKTVASARGRHVDLSDAALIAADAARALAVQKVAQPSWSVTSVTAEACHIAQVVRRAEGAPAVPDDPSSTVTQDTPAHRADAGMAWGTLIHGLLEHAMRQPDTIAEDLRRLTLWLTVEQPELRSVIDRAIEVVQEVSRAAFWQEAQASAEYYVETPFATADARAILIGVIDLVFRGEPAWEIVDYKTDRASDPAANEKYANQLQKYADTWRAITGMQNRTSIRQLT